MKAITDSAEIKDVDARIAFRSMNETGNLEAFEMMNHILQLLDLYIRLLKSLHGLSVKEAIDIAESASRIPSLGDNIAIVSFKEDILKLIAKRFLHRQVVYQLDSTGSFRLLLDGKNKDDVLEGPELPFIREGQKLMVVHLESLIKQELGEKWEAVLKKPVLKGLVRDTSSKGWPFVKNNIYMLYKIMLEIYPVRAHMFKLKEWKGEKAKYPQTLIKDLVAILKDRFPKDFTDLTEKDIISCIQYREKASVLKAP